MKYTLEDLKKLNSSFLGEHTMHERDVELVNEMIARIEQARSGEPQPMSGDRIICISPTQGQVSETGHLNVYQDYIEVNVYSDAPFMTKNLRTRESGGPCFNFTHEDFLSRAINTGKTLRSFWIWGSWGQVRAGGLYFQAEVNRWELTDAQFYKHNF